MLFHVDHDEHKTNITVDDSDLKLCIRRDVDNLDLNANAYVLSNHHSILGISTKLDDIKQYTIDEVIEVFGLHEASIHKDDNVRSILSIMGYHLYEDTPHKKAQHRWHKEISDMKFHTTYHGCKGTIIWHKRNEVVLKKGAILLLDIPLNKDGTIGFSVKMANKLREDHQASIANNTTIEDIALRSINEVGLFLYFGGSNGWLNFINEDNQTIDEVSIVK